MNREIIILYNLKKFCDQLFKFIIYIFFIQNFLTKYNSIYYTFLKVNLTFNTWLSEYIFIYLFKRLIGI